MFSGLAIFHTPSPGNVCNVYSYHTFNLFSLIVWAGVYNVLWSFEKFHRGLFEKFQENTVINGKQRCQQGKIYLRGAPRRYVVADAATSGPSQPQNGTYTHLDQKKS